jgi:hypothetical protein
MTIARMKLVAAAIMAAPCALVPVSSGSGSPGALAGPDGRDFWRTCETTGGPLWMNFSDDRRGLPAFGHVLGGASGSDVPTFQTYFPGSTLAYLGNRATMLGLPAAPGATREASASDRKSTTHGVPIPLNGQVLGYVDLFRGSMRGWFQEALERGAPHLPMIQRALRAEGLPLDLAYIPIVESAFRPEAVSRAGAKGLWQFMRGTAIEQGLRYDWYMDERSHPEKSTAAAIRYLKRLNTMFDGDWHLTLASYNGGPGRVRRAMQRQNTTGFWRLAAQRRVLPRQTREYVPMVLAAMVIGRNPAQYGFTVTQAERPAIDTVSLVRRADPTRRDVTRHPLDRLFESACGDTRLPAIENPR